MKRRLISMLAGLCISGAAFSSSIHNPDANDKIRGYLLRSIEMDLFASYVKVAYIDISQAQDDSNEFYGVIGYTNMESMDTADCFGLAGYFDYDGNPVNENEFSAWACGSTMPIPEPEPTDPDEPDQPMPIPDPDQPQSSD